MKKLFCISLLLFPFIQSSTAAPSPSEPRTLRVLSYNIHHGVGMDEKLDLKRIAELIKAAKPDIVSLQEVDNQTRRSKGINQAAELARLTGMNFHFGASMKLTGGQYGNAVLSLFKIIDTQTLPLPGEPRSAVQITLQTPTEKFIFIATHLDTSKKPRIASVPLIETLVQTNALPILLAGDLNALPQSPTILALEKTWGNATATPKLFTYPANQPTRQIDYIFYRPAHRWKTIKSTVLIAPVASDHRPILSIVQLLPTTRGK